MIKIYLSFIILRFDSHQSNRQLCPLLFLLHTLLKSTTRQITNTQKIDFYPIEIQQFLIPVILMYRMLYLHIHQAIWHHHRTSLPNHIIYQSMFSCIFVMLFQMRLYIEFVLSRNSRPNKLFLSPRIRKQYLHPL